MLDGDDDDGDVGGSDSDIRLRAALTPHDRQLVASWLVAGRRWRRRFIPWLHIVAAAAVVLSSLSSPVLTPLSMKCSVVVASGPQTMMINSAFGRGDCVSPVNCRRRYRSLLPDNPREPLTRCCSPIDSPRCRNVAGTTLPSPPWEVWFTPPDGILVLLVSESEWWRDVACGRT